LEHDISGVEGSTPHVHWNVYKSRQLETNAADHHEKFKHRHNRSNSAQRRSHLHDRLQQVEGASVMSCPSCGARPAPGAAFCGSCGAALAPTAGSQTPTGQRILTPQAEMAMRKAGERAHNVVQTLGPEKLLAIVGGVFGLLGALLPFYHVNLPMFIGAVDPAQMQQPSSSLVHVGRIGAIVICASIALGVGPLITLPTRAVSLVGFGCASLVLGMLLGIFFQNALFGRTFAEGFYCAILGFALLCYAYARRAYAAR